MKLLTMYYRLLRRSSTSADGEVCDLRVALSPSVAIRNR
jgi:hypothetical protein